MRYFFATKRRLLLLSVLLGVSFFVGGGLLFAQSFPFECRPGAGSESGGFQSSLPIPEGTTDTDALNQDKEFTIVCVNTSDPDQNNASSAKVTAQVIFYDLTANAPTFAGAGTGVVNQMVDEAKPRFGEA